MRSEEEGGQGERTFLSETILQHREYLTFILFSFFLFVVFFYVFEVNKQQRKQRNVRIKFTLEAFMFFK